MLQSRYHRAVGVARRALAEQEQLDEPCGDRLDESGALNALGVSLVATGEVEEGAAALRRALAIARERGDLQEIAAAAVNLGDTLHRVGRSEEALAVAREAHAEVASLPLRQVWLSLAIAHVAFDIGDWEAADAALAGVDPRRLVRGQLRAERLPRARGARARRATSARPPARSSAAPPSWRSTRASRSTSACSARSRRSWPRATATWLPRARRSTRRSTGSSSARTTRCGWRWCRPLD